MATFLETPSSNIEDIRRSKDNAKIHVTLFEPHIPQETHIREEKWDLRVFPMAINGTQKIAFIKAGEMVDPEGEELLTTYLINTWTQGGDSLRIQRGRKWVKASPNSRQLDHVHGLWLISDKTIVLKEGVPAIVDFHDLHLGELIPTWELESKKKREKKSKSDDSKNTSNDDTNNSLDHANLDNTQEEKRESATPSDHEQAATSLLNQIFSPNATTSSNDTTKPDTTPLADQPQSEGPDNNTNHAAQASSSNQTDILPNSTANPAPEPNEEDERKKGSEKAAKKTLPTKVTSESANNSITKGSIAPPPTGAALRPRRTPASTATPVVPPATPSTGPKGTMNGYPVDKRFEPKTHAPKTDTKKTD